MMSQDEIVEAGSLLPETIRQFLAESAAAYPDEVGTPDLVDWPTKLAAHAMTFCTSRVDGSLSAALFAYLNPETHIGYIPFICALPECEKGTAYRLHETYRQTATQRGMTTLCLEVLQSNTHAINFYTRQGYVIAEERSARNRFLMRYDMHKCLDNTENH